MNTTQRTGRGGWPLVPSDRFPGETCLACPACGSRNVVLSCFYGQGPDGRRRLGNPGGAETNTCADCGKFEFFRTGD